MIRGLIFDKDDTLIDLGTYWYLPTIKTIEAILIKYNLLANQEIKNDLEEFDDKEYPEHEIKFDEDIINEFKEIYNNLDESKEILNELNEIYETLKDNDTIQDNLEYPEIELETDDLKVNLTLKKDYSKIKDINKRKTEFFKDLIDFIEEFRNTKESDELMEYYNKKEES